MRATWPLYWLLSPLTLKTTPLVDALVLANFGLENEEGWLNSWRLDEELKWGPRRINSAMTMLSALLPNALKSNTANPSYEVPAIYVDAAERVKLRRFVEAARQAGIVSPQ